MSTITFAAILFGFPWLLSFGLAYIIWGVFSLAIPRDYKSSGYFTACALFFCFTFAQFTYLDTLQYIIRHTLDAQYTIAPTLKPSISDTTRQPTTKPLQKPQKRTTDA